MRNIGNNLRVRKSDALVGSASSVPIKKPVSTETLKKRVAAMKRVKELIENSNLTATALIKLNKNLTHYYLSKCKSLEPHGISLGKIKETERFILKALEKNDEQNS